MKCNSEPWFQAAAEIVSYIDVTRSDQIIAVSRRLTYPGSAEPTPVRAPLSIPPSPHSCPGRPAIQARDNAGAHPCFAEQGVMLPSVARA